MWPKLFLILLALAIINTIVAASRRARSAPPDDPPPPPPPPPDSPPPRPRRRRRKPGRSRLPPHTHVAVSPPPAPPPAPPVVEPEPPLPEPEPPPAPPAPPEPVVAIVEVLPEKPAPEPEEETEEEPGEEIEEETEEDRSIPLEEIAATLFGPEVSPFAVERRLAERYPEAEVRGTGTLRSAGPYRQSIDLGEGPAVRADIVLAGCEVVVRFEEEDADRLREMLSRTIAFRGRLLGADGFGRRVFVAGGRIEDPEGSGSPPWKSSSPSSS